MAVRPRVLVIDDGELTRFVDAFGELDVTLEHLRGVVCRDDLSGPFDVVVATVKRTLAFEGDIDLSSLPGKPTWIAVHSQDFLPLRVRLLRLGVDYLVQSSVNQDALRLLLVYVLHSGTERRSDLRLPVGSAVVCRDSAGASFEAELLDLALDGCRLLGEYSPGTGAALSVELPSRLAGGHTLELNGHVGRSADHPSGRQQLVVIFDGLAGDVFERLESILQGKVIGTVVTHLAEDFTADPASLTVPGVARAKQQAPPPVASSSDPEPAEPEPESEQGANQRANPRIEYTRKVTALLATGEDVVLGRNLSVDGMCVEPRPDLSVGLELELAIYGPNAAAEPVLVKATVARNDEELGTVFRFRGLSEGDRKELVSIVDKGAQILSLTRGCGDAEGVVISTVRSSQRARFERSRAR